MIPIQYALRRRMMMAALGSGIDVAALSITYTGAYTDYGMVTMSDGARYRLLAFTASGTLSIEQPVNCEVCVVGGGANGAKAANGIGGAGGAGAYLKNQSVSAYNGGSVVVGAGQGVSSIADVSVNAVSGQNGGTGAGGKTAGTGDGISKYPFEDTGYSLWAGKPHCGGGGQGAYATPIYGETPIGSSGGNGGTNGGNGYKQVNGQSPPSGGVGGSYGGGKGNSGEGAGEGENATYYGSGAGGGLCYEPKYNNFLYYNGGSGYQGIVYMRIPEEPPAYISDLPLGALINVGTDGGADAPNYEIADKDNLVSGGVVLVRKKIYSKSEFGSNANYPNSTLDNLIKTTIYNKMPQKLRDKMMDVSFTLSGPGNITRKMFAPTRTMVGFGNNNGVAEGKALQLYTSNTSRIKTFDGSAYAWWLSSKEPSSGGLWLVNASGGAHNDGELSRARGVVPAFVIPSETLYNATPNTDGSYNLIL